MAVSAMALPVVLVALLDASRQPAGADGLCHRQGARALVGQVLPVRRGQVALRLRRHEEALVPER
eukprot:11780469-Alexandrium_andersonii.AAC.1